MTTSKVQLEQFLQGQFVNEAGIAKGFDIIAATKVENIELYRRLVPPTDFLGSPVLNSKVDAFGLSKNEEFFIFSHYYYSPEAEWAFQGKRPFLVDHHILFKVSEFELLKYNLSSFMSESYSIVKSRYEKFFELPYLAIKPISPADKIQLIAEKLASEKQNLVAAANFIIDNIESQKPIVITVDAKLDLNYRIMILDYLIAFLPLQLSSSLTFLTDTYLQAEISVEKSRLRFVNSELMSFSSKTVVKAWSTIENDYDPVSPLALAYRQILLDLKNESYINLILSSKTVNDFLENFSKIGLEQRYPKGDLTIKERIRLALIWSKANDNAHLDGIKEIASECIRSAKEDAQARQELLAILYSTDLNLFVDYALSDFLGFLAKLDTQIWKKYLSRVISRKPISEFNDNEMGALISLLESWIFSSDESETVLDKLDYSLGNYDIGNKAKLAFCRLAMERVPSDRLLAYILNAWVNKKITIQPENWPIPGSSSSSSGMMVYASLINNSAMESKALSSVQVDEKVLLPLNYLAIERRAWNFINGSWIEYCYKHFFIRNHQEFKMLVSNTELWHGIDFLTLGLLEYLSWHLRMKPHDFGFARIKDHLGDFVKGLITGAEVTQDTSFDILAEVILYYRRLTKLPLKSWLSSFGDAQLNVSFSSASISKILDLELGNIELTSNRAGNQIEEIMILGGELIDDREYYMSFLTACIRTLTAWAQENRSKTRAEKLMILINHIDNASMSREMILSKILSGTDRTFAIEVESYVDRKGDDWAKQYFLKAALDTMKAKPVPERPVINDRIYHLALSLKEKAYDSSQMKSLFIDRYRVSQYSAKQLLALWHYLFALDLEDSAYDLYEDIFKQLPDRISYELKHLIMSDYIKLHGWIGARQNLFPFLETRKPLMDRLFSYKRAEKKSHK